MGKLLFMDKIPFKLILMGTSECGEFSKACAAHSVEIDFADFAPVSLSARAFANATTTAFCIIRTDCEPSHASNPCRRNSTGVCNRRGARVTSVAYLRKFQAASSTHGMNYEF